MTRIKGINSKQIRQLVLGAATKKKARGVSEHLRKYQFKKGDPRINAGGKPKVFAKFSEMLVIHMMAPCPLLLRKQLGLPRSANMYDAMVAAQILNAATGDNVAFMQVHNIIEGLLPTKNLNLSVTAEAFLQDPGFRQYLQENHREYLENGRKSGSLIEGDVPEIPAAEVPESD